MRKFLVALLGLLLLAGVFAAPQAQSQSTQVKLTIWADDVRTPVLRGVADGYMRDHPGVTISVVQIAFADLQSQFTTAAPTGSGPDILIGGNDWVGALAASGLLEPMDLGSKAPNFNPTAVAAFSYGGKLYGLPYGTENVALIYNKDLVPTPPKTWDELISIDKQLTDPAKGQYGFVFQNPDPYHWFPMLSAGGGYVFGTNPDGSLNPCDVGLASPGAIYGATLFQSMITSGLLTSGVDWGTLTGLFYGGKAGMVISGPWFIGGAQSAHINYGVAIIPPIKLADGSLGYPRPFTGVQGFMVSAFSTQKTVAFDFLLNYIATKDVMLALFYKDPRPPAYLPALNDPLVQLNADIKAFGAQAQSAIPMPNIPEMASVWSAWSDAESLIANGQADPQTALTKAVANIKAALKCP